MRFSTPPRTLLFAALSFAVCRGQSYQEPLVGNEAGQTSCHNACSALKSTLSSQVYYESTEGPPLAFINSYYAVQQREVIPACIFTPNKAQDITIALQIIKDHQCHFAVKSGGHGAFAKASNTDGGVTIDLKNLNGIEMRGDVDGKGEVTSVGPGNRWMQVYEKLEVFNKTVVGGRQADVGVGGFLLGGGISFVSRRYGWAADNIRSYEVILANGSIVNVNQESSPDLYWALRGGGNNFGIVTKFELETYPQGLASGGYNFYIFQPSEIAAREARLAILPIPFSFTLKSIMQKSTGVIHRAACKLGYCINMDTMIDAFYNIVKEDQKDPNAQIIFGFTYIHQMDSIMGFAQPLYSKVEEYTGVFDELRGLKPVYSTTRVANMTNFYKEIKDWSESGHRQSWATMTIKLDKQLLQDILDIYLQEVQTIKHVRDIVPAINIQPINKDDIQNFQKNGGNCLGIDAGEGALILVSTAFAFEDAKDDDAVHAMGQKFLKRSWDLAKSRGLHHRYIYQNYADISQDVFGGYGEENRKKLLSIQKKYDPEGVFSKLQPGYFKLQEGQMK
ncbi:hypothetical protein BGZ60DRAFT_478650 [Tricladium varicosporioides]|nr:hypothetical protein BGZ60DRAFT_478650 [Hymenoscyphus varicosporioides]